MTVQQIINWDYILASYWKHTEACVWSVAENWPFFHTPGLSFKRWWDFAVYSFFRNKNMGYMKRTFQTWSGHCSFMFYILFSTGSLWISRLISIAQAVWTKFISRVCLPYALWSKFTGVWRAWVWGYLRRRAASLARIDPRVTSPVVLYASFFGAGVGITLLGWLVHPLIYHRRVYFPPHLPQLESPLRSCNAHLLK